MVGGGEAVSELRAQRRRGGASVPAESETHARPRVRVRVRVRVRLGSGSGSGLGLGLVIRLPIEGFREVELVLAECEVLQG